MPFAGQWAKSGSFFVRRNSVIGEAWERPHTLKSSQPWDFPSYQPIIVSYATIGATMMADDGRRQRPTIAASVDVLGSAGR